MKRLRLFLAILFAGMMMAGCQDDESFSTSTSRLLTFTTDTLRLDTVFSAVPTTTRSFWVHNKSGDGLRLSSVRLERGNQSGFRVNVDGVYLGPSAGYQTSGVELRKGDSIRVFVELTSGMTGKSEPQRVEDNLVFTLESGVTQRVNLNAWSWDALRVKDLRVSRDTTIETDRPVLVYGKITVEPSATLTIGAGTTLYFHDGAGIEVYGRLKSEGEPGREVTLRGDRLDWMFDYLPYDLMSGLWSGVTFHESSYDNEIAFTDIHSTFDGIVCDSADVSRTKLTLSNSTIHNCQGYGLQASNCKLSIANCQLTNAMNGSLYIVGGDVEVNHCTLAQYYPFDANRGPALSFYATALMPLKRMDLMNSIVTGYADDQLFAGTESDSIAFNYHIASCILRTPEVKDTALIKHLVDVRYENVEDTAAIQGMKHFVLVDGNRQHYDFHLSEQSTAIDSADVSLSLPTDRDGRLRDERPDIGCFER